MKFFAYLSLIGLASTQNIQPMGLELEEEEVQNLLDLKMSRWAERRVGRKAEAVDRAWRAIRDMAHVRQPRRQEESQLRRSSGEGEGSSSRSSGSRSRSRTTTTSTIRRTSSPYENTGMTMSQMNNMQKDIFGWTFEEKYNQIKPMERYGPLAEKIAQSKEFSELTDYEFGTLAQDKLAKKIMSEAENLNNDLFGGRSRSGRYMRSVFEGDELRSRPNNEESRNMSRYQRDQLEIEGVHIENDDIKDVFEDLQDLNEDISDFLDPEYAPMAKAIKLDASLRWSPNVQKMMGMIADDFNIHNENEFNAAIGGVASRIGEKLENCPLFQRLRKTSERMVRAACKNAQIGDLPTGKRMQWVNRLAKDLYNVIKSDRPNRGIDRMVGEVLKELMREMGQYFQEVEKIEQSLKPAL